MIEVQFVRGSATTPITASSFVGPIGMVVIDTDTWCFRIQDGVTAGGQKICPGTQTPTKGTLTNINTGTSYTLSTMPSSSLFLYWTSTTAGTKTTNIPAAAAANAGYELTVKCTLGNGDTYTITPASGTIEGQASFTFVDGSGIPHASVVLVSDGISNWMVE